MRLHYAHQRSPELQSWSSRRHEGGARKWEHFSRLRKFPPFHPMYLESFSLSSRQASRMWSGRLKQRLREFRIEPIEPILHVEDEIRRC